MTLKEEKLYKKWWDMKTRCKNPNYVEYHRYGGRGITFCDRWNKFDNFKEDMMPSYKLGLTLDRIDNDKNYCPENCQWIPKSEQPKNRCCVRYLDFNGIKQSMADWARQLGINRTTLIMRLDYYNWSLEKTLNTGVQQ